MDGPEPAWRGPGSPPDGLVDGGLAAGTLAAVLAVARRRGVGLRPGPALAGAAGAVVLECILGRRREAVRRWWARPGSKVGSLIGLAVGIAIGQRIDEAGTLSAVSGGLVAYLVVLGAVHLGVLSAPGRAT